MNRLAPLAAILLVALGGSASAATTGDLPPTNSVPPAISGTATEGQTLTVSTGTWTGTGTITYSYRWYSCGFAGSPCVAVANVTAATYTLTAADVGRTVRATVTATDVNGSNSATAAPTATVAALTPPPAPIAAEELPTAIRAEDVVAPNGLAIDKVAAVPAVLKTRRSFKLRVHVADHAKLDVVEAYVTVTVPGGRVAAARGALTGDEGWAAIILSPTKRFVLKRGSLVLMVDAQAVGAGASASSARRAVRVQIVPPARAKTS